MLADVKEWLREEPRQALALGISAVALLLSFLEVVPGPVDPAWLAVLLCGVPIIKEGAEGLFTRFDIKADVLVSLALLASVIIGEIFAAGEVAFIMQLGALLEERTVAKARAGIERLVHLTPRTARRLDGTAESIIPAEEVRVDDLLRVLPGETIPVDGIIVSGQTAIDQSVMTGESLPVDKGPGDTVSSGTVNQFGAFDMRAVKVGEDSSLQRMIRLVQSADAGKARIVSLADRWATWIVVTALTAAAGTWIVTGEVLRAVTILVVFCPCALVLATPTAIMAAIGNATRHGVLVKEGDALERLARVRVVAFDKTGTLTRGTPGVAHVHSALPELAPQQLHLLTAAAERRSEHPLGKAIVRDAGTRDIPEAEDFRMLPGRGVSTRVDGHALLAGNAALLQDNGIALSPTDKEEAQRALDAVIDIDAGPTIRRQHQPKALERLVAAQLIKRKKWCIPEAADRRAIIGISVKLRRMLIIKRKGLDPPRAVAKIQPTVKLPPHPRVDVRQIVPLVLIRALRSVFFILLLAAVSHIHVAAHAQIVTVVVLDGLRLNERLFRSQARIDVIAPHLSVAFHVEVLRGDGVHALPG